MDLPACDRRVLRASLVVLPIDDFTGRPITGSAVRLSIRGQKPPVVKREGYHVFVNLTQQHVTLLAESGMYDARTEEIDIDGSVPAVLKLRLSPNASYPVPSDTTCVAGKYLPHKRLRIRPLAGACYKLLYGYQREDAEENMYLQIYNPARYELEGKTLYIQSKDKKSCEYITVIGMEKEGRYRLGAPLLSDYKKIGTELYPVYETHTDANGEFFLPLAHTAGQLTCLVQAQDSKQELTVELTAGKVNRIAL